MSNYIPSDARIYVAGHRGMVGSAIVRELRRRGYTNILMRTHEELDLMNQSAVNAFFEETRPEYVFLAAAKVGGIHANNVYRADFIYQNLMIEANVIHASYRVDVDRLLFLGSSCIYPRDCPQPIKEEYLLTGPLEATNQPYAISKIAGVEMCWSYNRQYGTRFFAAMPTNLYGPGDNYDLEKSHVIPALIRKAHEAKIGNSATLTVWGSGRPRREFLFCDDMGSAAVFLMNLPTMAITKLCNETVPPLVNIGVGEDIAISELTTLICEIVGYSGQIIFDGTKPDGTPRKLMDIKQITDLGWHPKHSLIEGLSMAYQDFVSSVRIS